MARVMTLDGPRLGQPELSWWHQPLGLGDAAGFLRTHGLWISALAGLAAGVAIANQRRGGALSGPARYQGPREGRLPRRRNLTPQYGRPGGLPFTRGDAVYVDTVGRVGTVVEDRSRRRVIVELDDGTRVEAPRNKVGYRIASVR